MDLVTKEFSVNVDVNKLISAEPAKKTFTWDSQSSTDLSLILNTGSDFELKGWRVAIECPVSGVQRNYRVPVIAIKDSTVLVIKPVKDPKKINISGLKMLDIKSALEKIIAGFEIRAVVYGFMSSFDVERKTSDDYEIWLRD